MCGTLNCEEAEFFDEARKEQAIKENEDVVNRPGEDKNNVSIYLK